MSMGDSPDEVAAKMLERSPEVERIEAKVRSLVEAYVRAWADEDKGALLGLFAEDGTWIDPVGTPPWQGRAKIAEFWDHVHANGSKITPTVRRIVVCGREAVLLFALGAAGEDGHGVELESCNVFVFDENLKISSGKAYWDKGCMKS